MLQKSFLEQSTLNERYTSEAKAQTQGVHSLEILIFSKIFIVFNLSCNCKTLYH